MDVLQPHPPVTERFEFPGQAPAYLCRPQLKHEVTDEERAFETPLTELYRTAVMVRRNWECLICRKPATQDHVTVACGLAVHIDDDEKEENDKITPRILGYLSPVCSDDVCMASAAKYVGGTVEGVKTCKICAIPTEHE